MGPKRVRHNLAIELNGQEFEQTPRDSEGQGSLVCYSPWGQRRVRHDLAIEQLSNCSEKTLNDGTKANMAKR